MPGLTSSFPLTTAWTEIANGATGCIVSVNRGDDILIAINGAPNSLPVTTEAIGIPLSEGKTRIFGVDDIAIGDTVHARAVNGSARISVITV